MRPYSQLRGRSMTTWEPRRLRKWLAWPKRSRRFARKAQRRVVLRTGHANASLLQVRRSSYTTTCGNVGNQAVQQAAAPDRGPFAGPAA
jgi:hypothetical protein